MIANGAGGLPAVLFFLEGLALVIELFAATDTDFEFGATVFEVDLGRHQGQTAFIDFACQFDDLFVVQKQFAHSGRVMIFAAGLLIGADVHVADEHFAVLDAAKGFLEIDLALPQGFDLGAGQHQSGFIDFIDEVVVISLFVGGDDFNSHDFYLY